MNELELAYLAGFFDGEGYLGLHRNPNGTLSLHVTISQKDRRVLDWIREHFGGNIHKQRACWNLNIHGPRGAELLKQIQSLLRVKRAQVDFVLSAMEQGAFTEEQKVELMQMKKVKDWDTVVVF